MKDLNTLTTEQRSLLEQFLESKLNEIEEYESNFLENSQCEIQVKDGMATSLEHDNPTGITFKRDRGRYLEEITIKFKLNQDRIDQLEDV